MRRKSVSLFTFLIFGTQLLSSSPGFAVPAGTKVRDFRTSNQKAALLGVLSEFVDETQENRILEEMRKSINRYTRSYGSSSIASFNLGQNPGKKFFKPIPPETPMDENQKKFLQSSGKDNAFEIVVLGVLRVEGEEVGSELQLYDLRTDTRSQIISTKMNAKNEILEIEKQIFKLMNFLDQEGFVGATSQDFLEMPANLQNDAQAKASANLNPEAQDQAVNPNDLSGGFLAGGEVVGGEKTPFWESWWFWSIIGGTVLTAGGLSYYFIAVDKPKENANVGFQLP